MLNVKEDNLGNVFFNIFFYTLVSGHQDCLVTKIIQNIDNTLQ